jgi:hypothetical protein
MNKTGWEARRSCSDKFLGNSLAEKKTDEHIVDTKRDHNDKAEVYHCEDVLNDRLFIGL